jgi:hypothetical protein
VSERTTSELLAEIDEAVVGTGLWNIVHPNVTELADRLEALDALLVDKATESEMLDAQHQHALHQGLLLWTALSDILIAAGVIADEPISGPDLLNAAGAYVDSFKDRQ